MNGRKSRDLIFALTDVVVDDRVSPAVLRLRTFWTNGVANATPDAVAVNLADARSKMGQRSCVFSCMRSEPVGKQARAQRMTEA